jgi:hypothetical protein
MPFGTAASKPHNVKDSDELAHARTALAQGQTRHQDIERAAELLGSTTNLLGIVLNKTKSESPRPAGKPSLWSRWFGGSSAG